MPGAVLTLTAHQGYAYQVVDGADLDQDDPPVWNVVEGEEAAVVVDGVPRAWSPPVLVGQWLHRLRVREYRNSLGAWYAARFEFVAGGETTRRFSVEGKPAWRVPPGHGDEGYWADGDLAEKKPASATSATPSPTWPAGWCWTRTRCATGWTRSCPRGRPRTRWSPRRTRRWTGSTASGSPA
ncbi:hypothetical protein [Saccharothrix xinjiangensis]|uniref:Uncharacterized protein n=1 Tax=Saccharothrix xinjiangensis TaxID=204798 RepID=A0ABV9XSC2_9PSEU